MEAARDTATVRAEVAIDPKQNIRAIVYYPMQLGRNVYELIRIFEALQTIDSRWKTHASIPTVEGRD